MDTLKKIIEQKKREVEFKKHSIPKEILQTFPLFNREPLSLASSVQQTPVGIIAEYKRRSPSKNEINFKNIVTEVTGGYQLAGASGISILTDTQFFGGSLDDLLYAKTFTCTPILRKDFIIDDYQVIESKAYGADAILLIAGALGESQQKYLIQRAKSIGLEVLLELHHRSELEHTNFLGVDLIGINNRNLHNFKVDLQVSKELIGSLPKSVVKITESGIKNTKDVKVLKEIGFDGFLIGEHFMSSDDPARVAKDFIDSLI